MKWLYQRPIALVSSTVCCTLFTTLSPTQQAAAFEPLASSQVEDYYPQDKSLGWNAGEDEVEKRREEALRWGHHNLRKVTTEDRAIAWTEFNTLVKGAGFRIEEIMYLLARAYEMGRGDLDISRNGTTALELYERAASMGHPASQHALATMLAASGDANGEVEAVLYDYFASLGGDVLAHAAMGYRYFYGIGVAKNCVHSFKHYDVAAREVIRDLYAPGRGGSSRPVDRTRLADRFVTGRRPISELVAETAEFWSSWAQAGNVQFSRDMGELHRHGTSGVRQDLEAAYQYYRDASNQDNYSKSMVGDMLVRGAGVEPDYEEALEAFLGTKEEFVSLNGLGYLHYHGLAVAEDVATACVYYVLSLKKEAKNPSALFNMGMVYKDDKLALKKGESILVPLPPVDGDKAEVLEIKKDLEKARGYLEKAASFGHPEAAYHVAQLLAPRNGSPGSEVYMLETCQKAVTNLRMVVERGPWMMDMQEALDRVSAGDYRGAFLLYSRLAEIGVEVAQSNAAWLLESEHCTGAGNAMGIATSNGSSPEIPCEERALRMHKHAARQGLAAAEVRIGDFYYFGKAGVPVDYEKAVRRYQRASGARHPEGLYSMGYMHQMGQGLKQDLNLAKRYYDDAAAESTDAIPVARLALLWLYLHGAYIRWCGLWEMAWPWGEVDSDESEEVGASYLTTGEVFRMLALMVSLMLVMVERRRRERRRLAEENADPPAAE